MNQELMENIESYLDGAITLEQLKNKVNPEELSELDEKIDWLKRSRIAIETVGLNNQLKEIFPSFDKEETKIVKLKTSYSSWYWMTASLAILLVSFWGIYFKNEPNLYDQFLYHDPGLPIQMSQSENYQLYDALSYYGEENYAMAERKLTNIQEEFGASDTISYYLGTCLLYQGKTIEAIAPFEKVQQSAESIFKEKADWMLLLIDLKENKDGEVKAKLSEILSNPDHTFFNQAKELNQTID